MMNRSFNRDSGGFTLIEVMVALVIAALALTGVMASISQMVDGGTTMRDRTYASWIAQNKIAEYRLSEDEPRVSERSGEVVFGDVEWAWTTTISETGVEYLYRIDVEVSFAGSDDVIRRVTGFVGERGIPGEANRVWAQGGPARGATN